MEALLPLIINLIGGAVGGNAAGAILKNLSLGTLGNSLVGIIGGGVASQLLPELLGAAGSMDIAGIITQIVSGGVGGSAGLVIAGLLKNILGK
jgi:uncharacterized membrane protein YeaQ/YmgE (transglycosylase-associated protein family)